MSKRTKMRPNYPDAREMRKLADVLEKFERETERDTGMRMLNGGFAVAEMFDYDNNVFDIELKWGKQSDVDDDVHIEHYVVDRKTWKITDAISYKHPEEE
jgi:hypothetical protein